MIYFIKKAFRYFYLEFLWFFYGGVECAKYLGVKVGKNCRIYIKNFGSEPFLISIGNKVTITKGVIFLTHDGSTWLFNDDKGRRYLYNSIEIGNNVFIGMNSILLPGVKIGDNVIVGAGSIVTKSIPPNSVVGGNPAKFLINYFDYRERCLNQYVSEKDFILNISKKENIFSFSKKSSFKPFLEK